ncbi:hypothetical protein DEIPH_ctg013orf0016 [Deinococcus phoenicis]|uniref:Uncharacterized protein n=1 Tax=Deinococcus phoenicis TaxID=1476583 RepID=A0A016QS79_9DEIO|nr:hypothetical protein [Deinococcus phoenicis]EYB68913.1 hypothetical protein DEIPH_ctg013orf0016 [Deinococcus phoenicis]
MTGQQLQARAPTLEQDMAAWGESYRAAQRDLNVRALAAYHLFLRWSVAGQQGDFSSILARHAGLSRTTAWRAWRAGYALHLGSTAATDQGDLVDAARALDNGATLEEVNAALGSHTIRDLAQQLDTGSVGRRMTAEAAQLRQQVQQRLGTLGLEHLPPAERDELVFRAFLTVSDETLAGIVAAYRKTVEGGEG